MSDLLGAIGSKLYQVFSDDHQPVQQLFFWKNYDPGLGTDFFVCRDFTMFCEDIRRAFAQPFIPRLFRPARHTPQRNREIKNRRTKQPDGMKKATPAKRRKGLCKAFPITNHTINHKDKIVPLGDVL